MSSLRRRVSEAAKNHLGVDITGISLFDAIIGQLHPSAPSASKPKAPLAKGKRRIQTHIVHQSHRTHQPYLNLSAP